MTKGGNAADNRERASAEALRIRARSGNDGGNQQSGCRCYTDNGPEMGSRVTLQRTSVEAVRITKDQVGDNKARGCRGYTDNEGPDHRESGCRGYLGNEGLDGGRNATKIARMWKDQTIERADSQVIWITRDQRGRWSTI